MADVIASSAAAARAADTLLRTSGGRSVLLRISSQATPGDATEQLGLVTPTFQDIVLAPVMVRRALATVSATNGTTWELLVSATAVKAVVGSLAFESGSVLFEQAFGVLVDGTLLEIEYATASEIFGEPYVYRLVLREPATLRT